MLNIRIKETGIFFRYTSTTFTRTQQKDINMYNNLKDQSKMSVAYRPAQTFSNLAASSASSMSVLSPLTMSASLALIPVATIPEPQVKNLKNVKPEVKVGWL